METVALVFAIGFGYLIWQEIPSNKTLIGAALVILVWPILPYIFLILRPIQTLESQLPTML